MSEDRRERRRRVTQDFVEVLSSTKAVKTAPTPDQFLPTGCSMLNLGLSDSVYGGYQKGKMANVIGDSSAGKTFLCLSALAEACQLETFDDYALVLDDAEEANEFDMEKLFGDKAAGRIVSPTQLGGEPGHSDTVQDFHDALSRLLDIGKPFIYILDSFDALDDVADQKKREEQRNARKKGTVAAGTFGMSKPKQASDLFKDIIPELKSTGSILLIISQTRDNIDPLSFSKKTRSGGNALRFYATHEYWLASMGKLKSKEREIGSNIRCKVTKNKVTGKRRVVEFPVYYDYGVDSIRSAIDFLIMEKHWEKVKMSYVCPEWDFSGSIPSIINRIHKEGLERELFQITQKLWDEIEKSLKIDRPSKYT